MAFFDDLGRKISDVGQSAIQKTKDMSGASKFSGAISDEEKKINENYLQIGKLYVAKHSADYESDFAGLVEAIKQSEANIAEYRQQMEALKGIQRCEKCGAELAKNAAFCTTCGAPAPKAVEPVMNGGCNCPNCGNAIAPGMKFCTSCGSPAPQVQQAPVAEPTPAPANNCTNCGMVLAPGMAFCTSCGTPVGQPAPVQEPEPVPYVEPVVTPVPQPEPVVTPVPDIQPAPAPTSVRVCSNCGAPAEEGTVFCTSCGYRL